MRDLADLGQSGCSVNTAALPQSSKTEENHHVDGGKSAPPPHPTPLRCSEQKQQQKEKREGEDGEIGGCLANLLSYTFLDVLALR